MGDILKEYKDINHFCLNNGKKKIYPGVFTGIKTVYAIGDIHGDFERLIYLLEKVIGVIKPVQRGIPFGYILEKRSDMVIVQLGDQLDGKRYGDPADKSFEPNDIKVIKFMDYLQETAMSYKSNFHIVSLLGNHEFMNLSGDYRYISDKDRDDRNLIIYDRNFLHSLLCRRHIYVIINNKYVFIHAGLLKETIIQMDCMYPQYELIYRLENQISLDDKINVLNDIFKNIIYGFVKGYINVKLTEKQKNQKQIKFERIYEILGNRGYEGESATLFKSDKSCININKLRNILHIDNMVVGHNIQANGINVRECSIVKPNIKPVKIYYTDVGISRAFNKFVGDEEWDENANGNVLHIKVNSKGTEDDIEVGRICKKCEKCEKCEK